MSLAWFNALPDDEAVEQLRTCCAANAWIVALAGARPYPEEAALITASQAALDNLDWAGVREALDAHPRIGERVGGASREAAWSRHEQSGTANSPDDIRAALVEANRAYEDRFGHVFLIFATGRTDTEMLAAARERVANDDETERAVVRQELGRIVDLRLRRMVAS